MSSLSGHARITQEAIRRLRDRCQGHQVAKGIAGLPIAGLVVLRDIYDVLALGHWLNYGQKHHFMRRADGQSPHAAWLEGCQWIERNARAAARRLGRRVAAAYPDAAAARDGAAADGECRVPALPAGEGFADRLSRVHFQGSYRQGTADDWQELGNALHALQDSFSPSHAVRQKTGPGQPGQIFHVKLYGGSEVEHHAEHDDAWLAGSGFSVLGELAIEACVALLELVATTAVRRRDGTIARLDGFDAFARHWLAAGPDLQRGTDPAYAMVDRFRVGTSLGTGFATATFSFDEEGLAEALVSEVKADFELVYAVFDRLAGFHQTDADDVAEYTSTGCVRPRATSPRGSRRAHSKAPTRWARG
jgi:hypothetical protein